MRIEIPERKKFIYQSSIPIRWGDMDAFNHVNNTVYFRYLEICRLDWMRSIGYVTDLQGEGLLIVNAFCNFYRQLTYPSDVLVKMYASDPGRTTFETWATMELESDPGVIYAAGGSTAIWVDFPSQKARTLPDWLRAHVS